MVSEKTLNAIKIALQNEDKSSKLYSDAAHKTANPVVKKTMLFLADWEKSHAEKIKRLHAHLLGESQLFNIKNEIMESPKEVVKDFFNENIDDFDRKLKGDADDIKVYKTGMDIEKAGYNFYKKAAKESVEEEAKRLFTFLAEEENIHFEFLQNQHAYLSDPVSWYENEEKWLLEG